MTSVNRRTLLGVPAALTASNVALGQPAGGASRLIATEEAFSVPEVFAATNAWLASHPDGEPGFRAMRASIGPAVARSWGMDLLDLDGHREEVMAASGIDTQLLLLSSPGVQIFDVDQATGLATLVNDRIAEVARKNPRRYAPLTAVAPQDPHRAAAEIERGMTRLGLHGILINSHTHGEYLDDPKFWPILEAAEAMNAPIYLHPREPSPQMYAPYEPYGLTGAIWGYAAETGLHAVRLIMAGVFDRFPRLQIVLGHLGEGLPFFIDRIDIRYRVEASPERPVLKRRPSDYLRENFHVTTSGMNWAPAVRQALEVMGPDRVQFAADWPFEDAVDAAHRFRSMTFEPDVRAKLAHTNAERVWRIAA
jgi:5-carboxyvanillate decarboxylase